MKAKYYTYFNLHKCVWSIKHKGKIVKHLKNCIIKEATTQVSEVGRHRVLKEKVKNVHAYLVSSECPQLLKVSDTKTRRNFKVWYNPYKTSRFMAGIEEAGVLEDVVLYGGENPVVYAYNNNQ